MKSQPAWSAAFARASTSPATPAPAIERSSLNTAPAKPRSPLRISSIQRREKPAGCASTRGYMTWAGITE